MRFVPPFAIRWCLTQRLLQSPPGVSDSGGPRLCTSSSISPAERFPPKHGSSSIGSSCTRDGDPGPRFWEMDWEMECVEAEEGETRVGEMEVVQQGRGRAGTGGGEVLKEKLRWSPGRREGE